MFLAINKGYHTQQPNIADSGSVHFKRQLRNISKKFKLSSYSFSLINSTPELALVPGQAITTAWSYNYYIEAKWTRLLTSIVLF